MKQTFVSYIHQNKLFESKDKILLAVSGGLDSMVMTHLFRECTFQFSVAHANFQLRGEESEGDEKFVKNYCETYSIPFFSKKVETENYAEQHDLSIQMAARELRYRWFDELANQHHFDFIVTAHHLNDSLETVLLNFVRGSGLEGWDGIAPKNGKIIRPMLFASRKEIEDYATQNKITWREDRSNASDDYQRNFLRHQVVPLLKELNPSLENSFSESTAKIAGSVEWMELGIAQWKEKFQTKKGAQIHFNKKGFERFKNPESILWHLIKSYGFNFDQCQQIIKAINESGKLFFSATYELVVDRAALILSRKEREADAILIEENQAEAQRGNCFLKIIRKENSAFTNNKSNASLDEAKLKFPLKWRAWKAGDSFHPLGMTNKKKISDFLIDEKISVADKKTISVLESKNEIAWVVGLRIDDRFKITSETKKIISFRVMRNEE